MAIYPNFLGLRQRKLPLYGLWNDTEILSKLEVMVELGQAVP